MPSAGAAARGAALASVLALLAGLLSGCSTNVAFRVDDRLTITAPKDRAAVTLPVKLAWRVHDFSGSYALFVDQAPVPPGKTLAYVARNDHRCKPAAGCPDAEYLASTGVYTAATTELVIERLPRDTAHPDRRERHRVVVVLLNAAGERVGESAYEVTFDVRRSSS